MTKERIMRYLPDYYQNSRVMGAIAEAQGTEIELLYKALNEILAQFFIDTATWGLDYWDEFLGLKTAAYPLEERRRLLKSKLAMQPPVTRERLKKLLEGVADSADVIEHYAEYSFNVILLVKTQLKTALEKIIEQVDETRPAHLAYQIILGFLYELQAAVLYGRWFSDVLKRCGTINTSLEEITTTLGRRYTEGISATRQYWLSELLLWASELTFPGTTEGLRYDVGITESKSNFFSIILPRASEATYCGTEVYA